MVNFLRGSLHPNEIQSQLITVMEDQALIDGGGGTLIAPDRFYIHVNPRDHSELFEKYPEFVEILRDDLIEVARSHDLILYEEPTIIFIPNAEIKRRDVVIRAKQSAEKHESTQALAITSVDLARLEQAPSAELIIDQRHIPLKSPLLHIGRHRNNDIIIDDMVVSRHHAQIRWRKGEHILIDLNSQNGSYVNGQTVSEKSLKSGDVITMGKVRMIYVCETLSEDEIADETRPITDLT